MSIPTTDEVDHTTPEERNALMGFCEKEQLWWKIMRGVDSGLCPNCGGKASQQIGFQIMSQRTFNPTLHGKKKLKKLR